MAVISVPRELREKLGDAGSESLVDLLRQVGGEQREDLIVVVEERFARRVMEARDELRSEMHTGFLDLQQQIGGVRAELHKENRRRPREDRGRTQGDRGRAQGDYGTDPLAGHRHSGGHVTGPGDAEGAGGSVSLT